MPKITFEMSYAAFEAIKQNGSLDVLTKTIADIQTDNKPGIKTVIKDISAHVPENFVSPPAGTGNIESTIDLPWTGAEQVVQPVSPPVQAGVQPNYQQGTAQVETIVPPVQNVAQPVTTPNVQSASVTQPTQPAFTGGAQPATNFTQPPTPGEITVDSCREIMAPLMKIGPEGIKAIQDMFNQFGIQAITQAGPDQLPGLYQAVTLIRQQPHIAQTLASMGLA